MSWDVLLVPLPTGATSVAEIAHDYQPPPIGTAREVLARLAEAAPGVDLSDPTWGVLLEEGWSMELGIGAADPVESVMLHIRGAGDGVLTVVFRLAEALGCGAVDCSDGELLTPDPDSDPASGWHRFQEYRDRVL